MRLAFARRTSLVFICSIAILALFATSAQAAFPGKNGRIAFVRSSGGLHIWTMEPDGSSQKRLMARRAVSPAWSPDGTSIASDDDGLFGEGGTIIVANADGSNVRELAHGRAFTDPSWSPNGGQIVFTGFAAGPAGDRSQAYRMLILNSDDGRIAFRAPTPMVPHHGSLEGERPAWSPRGDRIAVELGPYHRGVGETSEVFTMTPQGEDLRQLTSNMVNEYGLDWSPDGSELVYVRMRAHAHGYGSSSDIVVMGKNGHDVRVLTHTKRRELSAAFSPNGNSIVFSKCCYGESGTPEIFVMRADGTHVVRLTNNEAWDSLPDWQPIPHGR